VADLGAAGGADAGGFLDFCFAGVALPAAMTVEVAANYQPGEAND
jgi:hypothetical protein